MLTIRTFEVRVDLDGYPGEAVGSGSMSVPRGRLVGVQVKYGTQPSTTNVALTNVLAGVEKPFLSLSGNNSDVPFAPVGELVKGGDGVDTTVLVPVRVADEVRVDVDSGDPEVEGVTVIIAVEF